ncbi:MAG: DNA polymerase-1 [Chloroflexi bacterium]|jgi:DNA polymerase-1|nr:MAG: DNA polymerase-1 [Chloroflexota bacterium]
MMVQNELERGARQRPLLMLMDGHAMVYRAFYAIQYAMNLRSTGEEVKGVYGFTNTFLKSISDWNPSHCAIAFDVKGPTFRHEEFAAYKAQRPHAPPDLQAQFPFVKQILEAFEVPIYEMKGYEADDVIGTISAQAEQSGLDTIILTGDTDTLQLVSPQTRVLLSYSAQQQKVFDEEAVRERYKGLGPEHIPDIKGLEGDSSDNIPGIPGIGRGTAIKLLTQLETLDNIYERIDEVVSPRIRQLLIDHKEAAFEGRHLTTIVRNMPIKFDVEGGRFGAFSREKVTGALRDLEFVSMIRRIPGSSSAPPAQPVQGTLMDMSVTAEVEEETPREKIETMYQCIDTAQGLAALIEELYLAKRFAFDTETSGLDPTRADLVGLSFSTKAGNGFYVPLGHTEGLQVPLSEALKMVKPIFEDPSISKTAHKASFDMTVLKSYDIEVKGLGFDSMVGAQLLGYNAIGLKQLAFQLLEEEMTSITNLIGTGQKQITFDHVSIEAATPYAAADADMSGRLRDLLELKLSGTDMNKVLKEIEVPLVPVLVEMQSNGIIVDTNELNAMSGDIAAELTTVEEEVYKEAGQEFNIKSTQQLGTILFEKLLPPARLRELGLPAAKKTKTGYSTDASALETLKGASPLVEQVLRYRELSKLKSTYVDALPTLVNPKTGRVHTNYNQVGSSTGRFSSSDPNLQNIPVRTELGRQVRKAFKAESGWSLVAADYSQIELRILAHYSQDEALMGAFHRDEDIHAATASEVYDVPIDEVTLDMRRLAKVMNFGIIYGLSAHGMSQQTDLNIYESAKFIDSYFAKYPGIRFYVEEVKQQTRKDLFTKTLLGRQRFMPEINSPNVHVRQGAERVAINMPIQGTAADIIKIAMIRIYDQMRMDELQTRMLLQVHDELIFESPPDEINAIKKMILDLMPAALELSVPLKVDIKEGPNWGDLE